METKYKNLCCSGFLARGCGTEPSLNQHENKTVCTDKCTKLNSYNWLEDIDLPPSQRIFDCVEVRFKNSRKDFFRINTDYEILEGDFVAVESSPGHDIGIVSLTGEATRIQMRKKGIDHTNGNLKKVYRKARPSDIEKWIASVEKEEKSMYQSREAAGNLQLNMKISDVEYQGDGTKAIFYYTAEDRVDFRELIKILAELFKVRIEMRQIGVRQEASRLGGIGSCGRELCCSTWLTNFRSVTTHAARMQQLALNPQKLAGQCGKLKCCINYEYDVYAEAMNEFPDTRTILKTKKGDGIYQKSDVFKKVMWFTYENMESNLMAIPVMEVKKIIKMNEKGKMPEKLEDFAEVQEQKIDFENPLDDFDIERFDD
jgi:cell fate regulator YaaT (PSP1 superfamily)